MKKILSLILASLMIAVLAAGAAVSAIDTGASLGKVPVTGEKITVDGKADAIYDKGLIVNLSHKNNTTMKSESVAKLLWNGTDTIYVLIVVKNDSEIYVKDGGQPWDGDCSEIFVDFSNKNARNRDQYLIRCDGKAAYSGAGFSGVAYDNDVKKAGLNAWGATVSGSTITYEYEIKAYNEKIAKDAKIGIEIDVQDQSKSGGSTISYSDPTKSTNATQFGYITLSGDKVSMPAATTAATTKAPTTKPTAPATFDAGIILAVAAAAAGAGVVVSRKRK
ncbi:MAG: hypothetical protein E7662_03595 [Ruminococcaceae bacterium]|nr:hypothetical protein [Oscillospiraceae bacterium]